MEDKTIALSTAILGENKIIFVPLAQGDIENSIGFFMKKEGKFNEVYLEDLPQAIKESNPLFALRFKTKKSINELIRFLRFYRDNIYRKEQQNEKNI